MPRNKLIGKKAEDVACSFLQRQGMQVLARNYHCRYGEIDLIMNDTDTIVFVEVRYRSSAAYGDAIDSVDTKKQRRLIFTANHYLQSLEQLQPCRFDVVALSPNNSPEWISDAFRDSYT